MRVKVLYFAVLRELTGCAEEWHELPEGVATVADFSRWLERQRAELGGRLGSVRVARNERFAAPGEAIAAGDVLAMIPPVAGG
jgi:molybdopterin converting factor subunit 1